MIKREIEITIDGKLATMEDINLQKGDGDITLYFTIKNLPYTSNPFVKSQVGIRNPIGTKIDTNKIALVNDKIELTIKKEYIDETSEVGEHEFKIRLFDTLDNKITLPLLKFNLLNTLDWTVTQLFSLIDIDGFNLIDSEGYRLVTLDN